MGAWHRSLQCWIARAMIPFPVPLSPRMRTVASLGATCRASSIAARISGLELSNVNSASESPSLSSSPATCCSRALSRANALGDEANLRGREGLGKIVGGPPPHRFDRGFDGGIGGDDYDLEVWSLLQQAGDQIEAGVGAEPQIDKGHVQGPRSTADTASPTLPTAVTRWPSP